MSVHVFFIRQQVHVIFLDSEPLGGVGDRGGKGEDQMSAESSEIEDSKDGRDGLGHQVSIVRLLFVFHTQRFLFPNPPLLPKCFSRHDLRPKPAKNQPLIATCNVPKETKTDAEEQSRGNPRPSHVSSLSFPPGQGRQLLTVTMPYLSIPWQSNMWLYAHVSLPV